MNITNQWRKKSLFTIIILCFVCGCIKEKEQPSDMLDMHSAKSTTELTPTQLLVYQDILYVDSLCSAAYQLNSNWFISVCNSNDTDAFFYMIGLDENKMDSIEIHVMNAVDEYNNLFGFMEGDSLGCTECDSNAFRMIGVAYQSSPIVQKLNPGRMWSFEHELFKCSYDCATKWLPENLTKYFICDINCTRTKICEALGFDMGDFLEY